MQSGLSTASGAHRLTRGGWRALDDDCRLSAPCSDAAAELPRSAASAAAASSRSSESSPARPAAAAAAVAEGLRGGAPAVAPVASRLEAPQNIDAHHVRRRFICIHTHVQHAWVDANAPIRLPEQL